LIIENLVGVRRIILQNPKSNHAQSSIYYYKIAEFLLIAAILFEHHHKVRKTALAFSNSGTFSGCNFQ